MTFQLPVNVFNVNYSFASIFVALLVIRNVSRRASQLDAIPTVGSSSWLGSWWAGITYLKNAQNVVQEGYDKFKSMPFKFVEAFEWKVIVTKRAHMEELAKASDEEFSSWKATESQFQMNLTLGSESTRISRYLPFVGACVSRNIDVMCPEIGDEIVTSFSKVLDLAENEWKSVPALSTIEEIVCRSSNRVFVGLPLSRDPNWMNLSKRCADDLIKGGYIIALLPKFMRSLTVRYFTEIPQTIARCVKLLHPVIEERQKYLNKCRTEWDDKPNDLLSWLMEDMQNNPDELTAECLIVPLLLTSVAALSTVSNAFTQALFCLAANPQYIQPLREEAEGIIGKYGWSKIAQSKMRRIDSFLKECQRTQGINTVTLARIALKDFTFSDGTFIPKGTPVGAACQPIHRDEEFYESPDVFKPFRFVDMHEEGDSDGTNQQFITTTLEFLPFGHGRHACPGRFLAGCEMKFMMAYIVMTYDVKLEDNATMPPHERYGLFTGANSRAKVMFRNRVD